MIESRIDTIRYENGEMQRFQIVSGFAWNDLEFVQPPFSKEAFDELCRMYKIFVIPKHHEMYGAVLAFHIPDDMDSPFSPETEEGVVFDRQLAAAIGLRKLVKEGKIRRSGDSLAIDDAKVKAFLDELEKRGWLSIAYGDKTDVVSILPVGEDLGYMSQVQPQPSFICNAHFFEMDVFDSDSPYDLFGTPYGMTVKNGIMIQPPLNGREAMVVDMDGKVKITRPDIREISMQIQGKTFTHGENCTIYRRPDTRQTPSEEGLDLMIVGDEVVAFHQGGGVFVPTGGFVLHTKQELSVEPSPVVYLGMEDCLFAIQVGSSSVKDGALMKGFESPFYNIYKDSVPFPPTLYPLDYEKDRAPRMAICSDNDGDPVIVWAEGCSKLFYQFGKESCGASLLELGRYCASIGLVNVLNLDGGGSSEIFLNGKLMMHVSDRHADNSDAERPVPMGFLIK
ncbi:MAG: phosphodiester glycosidase family protein [Spirochaetales bacterium]|nr:phosphodiester glycosidase family protein [Spirochaetales bacterium]